MCNSKEARACHTYALGGYQTRKTVLVKISRFCAHVPSPSVICCGNIGWISLYLTTYVNMWFLFLLADPALL